MSRDSRCSLESVSSAKDRKKDDSVCFQTELRADVLAAVREETDRARNLQSLELQEHVVNMEQYIQQQQFSLMRAWNTFMDDFVQKMEKERENKEDLRREDPNHFQPSPPKPTNGMEVPLPGELITEVPSIVPPVSARTSTKSGVSNAKNFQHKKSLTLQLPSVDVNGFRQRSSSDQHLNKFVEEDAASVVPICKTGSNDSSESLWCDHDKRNPNSDSDDHEEESQNNKTSQGSDGQVSAWPGASFSRMSSSNLSIDTALRQEDQRQEWNDHIKSAIAKQLAGTKATSQSNDDDISKRRGWGKVMSKAASSQTFNWFCVTAVLVNAAFIGLDTHLSMDAALRNEGSRWTNLAPIHTTFAIIFSIELLIRIAGLQVRFLTGPDWKWNGFDTVLVLSSICEEILEQMSPVGFLRVLRGIRMIRVLRLVRVFRVFRDLRLMVCSVMKSFICFFWGLMLLFVLTYLASVFAMQGSLAHLTSEAANELSPEFKEEVAEWFCSLPISFMTMIMCITGGIDWVEAIRPLLRISWVYAVVFILYILFVMIGVLNVLTGIFVERAQELSGLDRNLRIQGELQRNDAFLAEMKGIFTEMDTDGSGTITWEEFREYLQKEDVKAYLATHQLEAYDARQLFNILDLEDDQEVKIEEFIMGCMRLKGMAKSVDVVALLQESRKHNRRFRDSLCDLQDEVRAMMRQFGGEQPLNARRNSFRQSTRKNSFTPNGAMRASVASGVSSTGAAGARAKTCVM